MEEHRQAGLAALGRQWIRNGVPLVSDDVLDEVGWMEARTCEPGIARSRAGDRVVDRSVLMFAQPRVHHALELTLVPPGYERAEHNGLQEGVRDRVRAGLVADDRSLAVLVANLPVP